MPMPGQLCPAALGQLSAGLLGCRVPSRSILALRDFLLLVNVSAFKTNTLHCIFCFGLGWAIIVFLNSTVL